MCPSWGQDLVSARSLFDWLSAHVPILAHKKRYGISHVARYPVPFRLAVRTYLIPRSCPIAGESKRNLPGIARQAQWCNRMDT